MIGDDAMIAIRPSRERKGKEEEAVNNREI